jgi:hypothetical protein
MSLKTGREFWYNSRSRPSVSEFRVGREFIMPPTPGSTPLLQTQLKGVLDKRNVSSEKSTFVMNGQGRRRFRKASAEWAKSKMDRLFDPILSQYSFAWHHSHSLARE